MPIIPEFLYDINHPDAPLDSVLETKTTTTTPYPPCEFLRENLNENLTTTISPTDQILGK